VTVLQRVAILIHAADPVTKTPPLVDQLINFPAVIGVVGKVTLHPSVPFTLPPAAMSQKNNGSITPLTTRLILRPAIDPF